MAEKSGFATDLRAYLTGYVLSVVLTLAAFAAVLSAGPDNKRVLLLVGLLGVAQLVVQLKYFLHATTQKEQRENLALVLFSTLILLIIVLGTVWIMGNLAVRMHTAL
ncbi:cytochrome o ubiquinol oxidase subunit IV [Microbulbifer sp. 2205BS26-8]|uniref:cytochrome o ubiquinol oxidase subunit IV n=1 Tax=Microbulbifer sp. 2205BS26-8 TaxID=3064386 RepID=UPI00273ECB34|nr:cytochrome o ubiquinol oxidase subunit IV [Microbulbifer sp. 2205BS26-8]MDP5210028.1 cytochrome o ubiquinol oxidase subunit IV [Microbulbifer sp. 2205BS26-8]